MASAIDKNQYTYLTNMSKGNDGNAIWAKNELANSTYTPSTPMAPVIDKPSTTTAAPKTTTATTNQTVYGPPNASDIYKQAMQSVATNYPTPSLPTAPTPRQSISYDQAQQQAQQQLGYSYDKMKDEALEALKNDQIRRGVYGQAYSDKIGYDKGLDLDAQKSSAIASLANSLMMQDAELSNNAYSQALQQYKLQYDAAMQPYEQAKIQAQQEFENLVKLWGMDRTKDNDEWAKQYGLYQLMDGIWDTNKVSG